MGTREVNRWNAKKSPGLLPQNGRSPGGIQKDELHPSQLTKGEAHKNLAVKRPTAMVAGRGMGTTATSYDRHRGGGSSDGRNCTIWQLIGGGGGSGG